MPLFERKENPKLHETPRWCQDFYGDLNRHDVEQLVQDEKLRILFLKDYCDHKVSDKTWELLNNELFAVRPEIELKISTIHVGVVLDLEFAGLLSNVEHFYTDFVDQAIGVENIAAMKKLKTLSLGIYNLESFEVLNQVSDKIEKLYLARASSKKPDLLPLKKFKSLKFLYIEKQNKNIEVISELHNMEDLTLRSISRQDLSFIAPLHKLKSLDIKLGGIPDLRAITKLPHLEYLELWKIRGLTDISFISEQYSLKELFLQSLLRVVKLPDFSKLAHLKKITLENLRSVDNFQILKTVPALEELWFYQGENGNNYEPRDFVPALNLKSLKLVSYGFSTIEKRNRFKELV